MQDDFTQDPPPPPPMQYVMRGYVPGWAVLPLTIGCWLTVVMVLACAWVAR